MRQHADVGQLHCGQEEGAVGIGLGHGSQLLGEGRKPGSGEAPMWPSLTGKRIRV